MAQLPLTPDQHRQLVRLIAARAGVLTPLQRENLLERAGLLAFREALHFDTSPQEFSQQLVRVLQDHGTLAATGQPALVSLLRELRQIVAGHEDEAAFVDSLLALSPQTPSTPRPAPPEPPPATPPGTAQRPDLDAQAGRNARRKLWGFLVLLGVAWLGIVVGIALFGWDVMEPVTFVVGGTLTLGGYAYFALTLQELSPAAFYTRLVEQERRRLSARQGLAPDAHGRQAGARSSEPPAVILETPPRVTTPPPVDRRALEEAYLDLRCRDEVAQDFAPLDAHVAQAGTGQVQRRPHRVEMRPLFRHRPELERLQEVAEERLAPPERETREYTDIIRAIEELRRVVLLGEPGAGKTTTLRTLEMDRIERARRDPAAPIPLFVPLGRWTRPDQPLPAFMAAQMGALGDFLDSLLAQERAVLLLDGLDQIPPAQREAKARQVKALFKGHPALISVVSCREQDYTLDLGFDRLVIMPLDPARIQEFAHKYLGQEEGERFFWRLAGGGEVHEVWQTWERAGATWEQFWNAPDVPREKPDVYSKTTGAQDAIWRKKVRNPASLMTLAGNPYMLLMLVAVYQRSRGELPANRGRLFAEFVATLLEREKLATRDEVSHEVTLSPEAEALLAALARLAYEMQVRRAQETGEGSAVTVLPRAEVVPALLSARQLYLGASTNILSAGEEVRFSHQLLQEYFAATFMQGEIAAGRLRAEDLWPLKRWWERTNWEEATVLLAGLHSDDCTPVLEWVAGANPEVAADCIARSGAATPPATLARLRERWLPRLSDLRREPDPRGRAAVGRALAVAGLDDRPGVGLRADGLPDIVWVELPGGRFPIGGDEEAWNSLPAGEVELPAFWMAKYPITNRQFQAFVEAADGYRYREREWWQGLAQPEWEPVEPYFPYGNHPRETVSWYEAVAFCRWLSARLGYEVRLPTEAEWERAARGEEGRFFPWGPEYISGFANIDETARLGGFKVGPYFLGQTSAVGIYPQGVTPEGVEELAGNVWEWTLTEWEHGRNDDLSSPAARVVRGGSWDGDRRYARAASPLGLNPVARSSIVGFRVVSPAPGRRMNSAADRQNPLKTG